MSLAKDIIQTFILTVVFFFGVQTFVGQPYQVEMHSMQSTLEPGQYVFVDKLTPRFDAYHRGDIVVFGAPQAAGREAGTPFIKRVIGVGGDTVEIRDGQVWVNDVAQTEPYVYAVDGVPETTESGDTSRWLVPTDEVFLMGDHRWESVDSRFFGPVPVSTVVGRAWLRYWPLDSLSTLGGTAQATTPAP
jgi:signal peptidase I